VAFLDADDVWLQSHLECSVRRLEDTQADVAYSTVVKFEDRSGLLLGLWGPTKRDLETFPGSLLARNFVVPSATVLRRHVVDQVGPFDTSLRWCEDFDYWIRCVMAGMQFVHVPGCHCLYRKGAPTAGSSNLRAVNEHHALVLAKHFGAPSFPKRQWRRQLAFYCLTAGVLNLETDARSARRLFWKAWRTRPERLDLLLLGILAASAFRWLPVGPVVRRLRKAKGY
jgi:GT2 family glycosyltransferase